MTASFDQLFEQQRQRQQELRDRTIGALTAAYAEELAAWVEDHR